MTAMADFRDLIDLASERIGGSVLYANDDFFAEKENLIRAPNRRKPVGDHKSGAAFHQVLEAFLD